jgi:hypothetical protein
MANPVNRGFGIPQGQSTGSDVLRTAKDKVQEFASNVSEQAEEAWDSVARFFRRNSIPLFFAGIGLGFLLAKALENWPSNLTSRMSESNLR